MIAGEGRVSARLGRQVRRGRRNRLDTWLLIIGDDRHRVAGLCPGFCRGLLDELHLAIDTQHFRHLGLKIGVTAFQVVTDLVWLDLLLVEDDAQRALSKLAQAIVPPRGPHFRAQGPRAAASSTIRGDSRAPWPCGTPDSPPRPWPRP